MIECPYCGSKEISSSIKSDKIVINGSEEAFMKHYELCLICNSTFFTDKDLKENNSKLKSLIGKKGKYLINKGYYSYPIIKPSIEGWHKIIYKDSNKKNKVCDRYENGNWVENSWKVIGWKYKEA